MGSSQWGEKQETEKKHLIVLKFRWYTNEDKKITEVIFILCFEFEDTLRSALCPANCPVQKPKKRGVCEGQQSSVGWNEVSSVMNLKSMFVRFLQ